MPFKSNKGEAENIVSGVKDDKKIKLTVKIKNSMLNNILKYLEI
jgi:hypothetical protein